MKFHHFLCRQFGHLFSSKTIDTLDIRQFSVAKCRDFPIVLFVLFLVFFLPTRFWICRVGHITHWHSEMQKLMFENNYFFIIISTLTLRFD